jgi:hypothetical protein
VDLALSRLVSFSATRAPERRLNGASSALHQGPGLPGLAERDFVSGTFGRITTMTGHPRIVQFGINYGFRGALT